MKHALLALACTLATLSTSLACADEPTRGQALTDLEEVLVTARKKTEALTETPVAITAFNELALRQKSIQGMQDIAYLTPGLTFESFVGGNNNAPTIRGMNQSRLLNREQNVSTFIDGVYIQSQGNIDVSLLDLERVEVIKGPQSSLYGRNSFAGAVNYITTRPGAELQAKVSATRGDHGLEEQAATLHLPVTSWLALSGAVNSSEFDGTFTNTHPNAGKPGLLDEHIGGWDKEGAIAGLYLDPTESLSLNVKHYDFSGDYDPYPFSNLYPNEYPEVANCGQYTTGGGVDYALYCGNFNLRTVQRAAAINTLPLQDDAMPIDPRAEPSRIETLITSGGLRWSITDQIDLQLSYADTELRNNNFTAVDGDQVEGTPANTFFQRPTPFPIPGGNIMVFFALPIIEQNSEQWETRVSFASEANWNLSAGAYLSTVSESSEALFSLTEPPGGDQPVDKSGLLVLQSSRFSDRIEAAFVAGDYAFSDALTLSAELRKTREHKAVVNLPSALTPTAPPTAADAQFDYVTWRVIVDYLSPEGPLFYASLANGVKGGGFNSDGTAFQEESNITLEAGIKFQLDDLQANVAVFYTDWSDLQISVPDSAGSPVSVTGNLDGGATIMGFEVEARYKLPRGFRIEAGAAVNSTEFSDDAINNSLATACGAETVCTIDISGNEMPRQSDITFNAGLLHRGEAFAGTRYFVRVDGIYQSEQWMSDANLSKIEARKLVNARAGLSHPEQGWSLEAWVKNALDRAYVSNATVVNANDNSRQLYGPVMGTRRTAGITLRYDFN